MNGRSDDEECNDIQDEIHSFSTSRLNIRTVEQQNGEEMEDLNMMNENHFTDDSHISFRSNDAIITKEFVSV